MSALLIISESYVLFGSVVFALSSLATSFVRYVFFPVVMPNAASSDGLLLATDSINYHSSAVELAAQVNLFGWDVWELTPNGNIMEGFLAALYVVCLPEAWVSIPFSAMAHAVAAILMVRLARFFTDDPRVALIAAIPYVLFPSAAFWYTQLLKDGYFNVGLLAFLVGWMLLAKPNDSPRAHGRQMLCAMLLIGLGYAIQGLTRPYVMPIALVVSLALLGITVVAVSIRLHRRDISLGRGSGVLFVACLCIAGQIALKSDLGDRFASEDLVELGARGRYAADTYWQETPWVPQWLDGRLSTLSGVRDRYIEGRPDAASTIDKHVRFIRAGDVFAYIPRAVQVGFLAPFPNQWFGDGSTNATTIMRRISMIEMLFVYGLLPFVLLAAYCWRCHVGLWIAATYPSVVVVIYALATPNIGTLYRVRYGYLMIFLALAITAIGEAWKKIRISGQKWHL